ncbi:hypothetical protein KKP97_04965 [Methanothermococcus sp. SCGC AD-155-C09]|nr:hypothetical protein [Methanothermococcus sp. SCGC AD-155-C09]
MLKKLLIIVFFMLFAFQVQGMEVIKISNYTVNVDVDKNPQHIAYNITLQNMVNYPLVPGIGEFRLQKQESEKLWIIPIPFTKEVKPLRVENLKGYYSFDGVNKIPMKTYVEYHNNYSIIKYEIWEPIEKRGNISIFIEYDANILDEGILFKTLSIPVGCSMNIDHLHVRFNTKDYSQTYQNPSGDNFKVPKNTLFMINAEFSIIPLPRLPTYGYIIFWLIVFTLLLIILIYGEIRSLGKEKNGDNKKDSNENNNP